MEDKKVEKFVKKNIEHCKATYLNGNIFINFKGYGIKQKNTLNLNSDIVKVEFSGKIGSADFLFKIIR